MNYYLILFYIFASLVVVASMYIVFTKNILHAALALLAALLGIAAIFVLFHADFVAISQIMIYIGAILVLIIFGLMFTVRGSKEGVISGNRKLFPGLLAGALILGILLYAILIFDFNSVPHLQKAAFGQTVIQHSTVSHIGMGLMTDYILPFEIAAVLLLVAVIGAAFIAGKRND